MGGFVLVVPHCSARRHRRRNNPTQERSKHHDEPCDADNKVEATALNARPGVWGVGLHMRNHRAMRLFKRYRPLL